MARTNDDIYNKLEELIDVTINGGGFSGGYTGGGLGRRRGGPDPYSNIRYRQDEGPKSVEELIERYERIEELEIGRFKRMKEQEKAAKEYLDTHKDALDAILEKKARGEELSERENEILREGQKAAHEYGESMRYLSNHTGVGAFTKTLSGIGSTLKQMYTEIHNLGEPWREIDAAASKYAKTIGLTSRAMKQLSEDTNKNVVSNDIALRYNVDSKELLAAQENYMKAAGRNIRVSNSEQETIAAMALMGGKGNELAAMFDNFGVSLETTGDHVGKMFADATKQGLSVEKYSDNVAKNIKIAQNYTFKNGLKGLESMAKKATAMKMDMQQVAALADKVSTVEGAIDVSAQLQVLGGPFAQLADPLGMLNEGLNDMEGLQDRLIKMVGGLGSFDKETGEVKVSAFNKQRIKAASQAMGVSYDTIMESVNAQARRGEISKQIAASQVASGFDNDMKELIMNSGTIKDGKAGVSIRGKFKALDEITEEDRKAIEKESQVESKDIKDIAFSTRSLNEIEEGVKKDHREQQAQFYKGLAKTMATITEQLGGIDAIHKTLIIMQAARVAGSILDSGKGLFSNGKRGFKNIFSRSVGGSANTVAGGTANAMKGAKSTISKAITKATGGVVKGSASRTAKRAAIKILGKQGAKTAIKLGTGLAKGVAVGGPLGIVGAIGDVATDSLVASGKMKKGGVGHHLAKGAYGAVSGAALGAMVGSAIPVIGTAAGAVVGGIGGAISGLVKAEKAKQERKLEEKLSETGITVQGKYNGRKLKEINAAFETGEVSKRLRRKLEKNGDQELLAIIDKKAEGNKDTSKTKKKFFDTKLGRAMMIANPMLSMGVLGARGIKKVANSKVGQTLSKITNPQSKLGKAMMMAAPMGAAIMAGRGVSSFFKKNKIEKFQGKSKKSAADILSSYNTTIKPILEKGNNAKYGAVNKTNNDIHLKSDPHDIKINGTLNLKGQDGKTIDIVSELKNNPQMLRQVSGMISNEMGVLQKGINVVQRA